MQLAHNDNGTNEFLYLRIRRRRRRSLFRRFPWISSIKRIETVRIRIEIINWLVLSEKFVVNDLRRVDSSQNRLSRNKNRRRDEFLLCFSPTPTWWIFLFFFFSFCPTPTLMNFSVFFFPTNAVVWLMKTKVWTNDIGETYTKEKRLSLMDVQTDWHLGMKQSPEGIKVFSKWKHSAFGLRWRSVYFWQFILWEKWLPISITSSSVGVGKSFIFVLFFAIENRKMLPAIYSRRVGLNKKLSKICHFSSAYISKYFFIE